MEIKRTTEIFFEARRRFVIRNGESVETILCPTCASPMLSAEQFAEAYGIGRRSVYQSIEQGRAHFAETETGTVMICPPSFASARHAEAICITDNQPPAADGTSSANSEK